MCGINGFTGRDEGLLTGMNAAIRHRGPDYAGTWLDDGVSLGHVLLSIRGVPDASRQPFQDPGSDWILLFNGQLYNTSQLKAMLGPEMADEELDTRLLYEVIKKRGWDFFRTVHGMFAIGLYNKAQREIRLYRDASGQKPVYYYCKGGRFAFSSEIKGLLTLPFVDREPDHEAVEVAASLGYIPGERTLFRHIKKVRLSQEVAYRLEGGAHSTRMLRADLEDYYPEDDEETFHCLIDEHLQSKRKVSINLSGGLDSSLILHEMARKGMKVDSYTTYFDVEVGSYNQDAGLARRLSKDYGTNHHEVVIGKKDFLEATLAAYVAIEEPNYNNSVPHIHRLFGHEGIRGDGNRVILTGDGGDEIFAGYPHHLQSQRIDWMQRLVTVYLYNRLVRLRSSERFNLENIPERWYYFRQLGKSYLKRPTLDVCAYVRSVAEPYLELYRVKDSNTYKMMLVDRSVWLESENFIRSDKLAMAQSLEVRAPLSYMPFREAMDRRIPDSQYHGRESNKIYLRNHYREKLPLYIVDRPQKTGWRSPIQTWWDKSFQDLYLDVLTQAAGPDTVVDWKAAAERVRSSAEWPGKKITLYLSLALLKKEYGLDI